MSKFCRKCGAVLSDSITVCPNCGDVLQDIVGKKSTPSVSGDPVPSLDEAITTEP